MNHGSRRPRSPTRRARCRLDGAGPVRRWRRRAKPEDWFDRGSHDLSADDLGALSNVELGQEYSVSFLRGW